MVRQFGYLLAAIDPPETNPPEPSSSRIQNGFKEANTMIEIYWGCLIGGAIFALLSLLGGLHHLHGLHALHGAHAHPGHGFGMDYLNPLTIIGGITGFGG